MDTPNRSGGIFRLIAAPLRILDEIRLVAAWDMKRQARRPSFFVTRSALALFLGGLVLLMWWSRFARRNWSGGMPSPEVTVNDFVYSIRSIFHSSVITMAIGLMLLCPALTSGAVAGDRERKIWHDLVNSPLSGWSILMGKMTARLATVVAWVLVAMPIWSILSLVGGLDPVLISLTMLAMFLYGWFYAAIGLMASVATKRSRDALGMATSLVGLLIFGPLFLPEIVRELGMYQEATSLRRLAEPLLLLNPAMTLSQLAENPTGLTILGGRSVPLVKFFAALALAGPALTLAAGLVLRPMGRRLDNAGAAPQAASRRLSRGRSQLLPDPAPAVPAVAPAARADRIGPLGVWFRPMAVKERRVRSGSRITRAIRSLGLSCYLLATSVMFVLQALPAFQELSQFGYAGGLTGKREQLLAIILFVNAFTGFILYYGLMLEAAGRMVMEKEQDTWTTLLSTPIEPGEIFAGKTIGALWSYRWVIGQLLSFWAIGLFLGALHPLGLMCAAIVWTNQLLFVLVLGLWIGLKSETHAGVVTKCIGCFLAAQFLGPLFLLFIEDDLAAAFQPVAIMTISAGVGLRNVGREVFRLFLPALFVQVGVLTFVAVAANGLRRVNLRAKAVPGDANYVAQGPDDFADPAEEAFECPGSERHD